MAPRTDETPVDENLRRMIAHHDEWSASYDFDIAGMVLYNRITLDNIRRFLPDDPGSVILDAGGGTGFWTVQLAEMGHSVVLVDLSDGMLAKAREKIDKAGLGNRIEVRTGDIRSMPEFADGRFAMVICEGDPVSYCGDHEAAVREFARVVRRGGSVIMSVDNRASALNWLRDSTDLDAAEQMIETGQVLIGPEREELKYWIHAFTPYELKTLFESNGLAVESLIGKPVIAHRLGARRSEDSAVQERLFQLELRYNEDPAYLPWAGHLEIAGRKR